MSKKRKQTVALDGTIYEGELAQQIKLELPKYGILTPDEERQARVRAFYAELFAARFKKLPALHKLYGIDPEDPLVWQLLAWRLACAHVPGFRIAARPGPF